MGNHSQGELVLTKTTLSSHGFNAMATETNSLTLTTVSTIYSLLL